MSVKNLASLVFSNLPAFLESRGLKPKVPLPSPKEFLMSLSTNGHVRIDSIDPSSGVVSLTIVATDSEAATKGAEFKKILDGYKSKTVAGVGLDQINNIIVIVPDETVKLSNIEKTFKTAKESSKELGYTCKFLMCSYRIFSLDITKAVQVPKHVIMTKEEVLNMTKLQLFSTKELTFILETDPPVIWIGGKPGDVIRITQPSETALEFVTYRLVV